MNNLVKEKIASEQYLGSDNFYASVSKLIKDLIDVCDDHGKDGYSNFEITFEHNDNGSSYDYYYTLYGYRQETEEEQIKRIQKEQKRLERMENKEKEERALFEELKKKYGN